MLRSQMGHQLPELGTRNSSTAALLNASLKSFAYDCRPHLIPYAKTPESKNGAIRLHLINSPRSGKTGFYAVRSLAGVESTKLLRAGFASSGLAGKYAIHDGISISIGQKRRITKYILSMKVRQRALNQIQELPFLTRFQPGVRLFGITFNNLRLRKLSSVRSSTLASSHRRERTKSRSRGAPFNCPSAVLERASTSSKAAILLSAQ
jgi:hypothetical protein